MREKLRILKNGRKIVRKGNEKEEEKMRENGKEEGINFGRVKI